MFKNKLNNKGFAISSVLYTLLTAFLLFLGAALAQFSSSAKILSKANNDLTDNTDNTALPYQVRIYYSYKKTELQKVNYFQQGYSEKCEGDICYITNTNFYYLEFANKKQELIKISNPKSCNDLIDDDDFCSDKSWKTTIHYCYKGGSNCELDTSLPGISNKVTMKSINKFVRENNPTGTVNWIQVFHTLTEN